MNPLSLHRFKLLLFTLLSLADLGLTLHLLDQGNGRVYEGNPLANLWLHRHGSLGLTLYKGLSPGQHAPARPGGTGDGRDRALGPAAFLRFPSSAALQAGMASQCDGVSVKQTGRI